jgi:hypothetical protein
MSTAPTPQSQVLQQELFPSPLALLLWAVAAALMGCIFALAGLSSIVALLVLSVFILFYGLTVEFPASMMGVLILCLGLVPFTAGLKAGSGIEVYGDEVLPLFCLVAFPFLYIFAKRTWCKGFGTLYAALAVFLLLQSLSFIYVKDSVAYRNFLDGYVLGAFLLAVFLQEGFNSSPDYVAKFIRIATIVIAALSILERVVLRNPLLEQSRDYISPELAQLTFGVYRPYVTFFHPSEAGTFMALGVPFVIREFIRKRTVLSLSGLVILAAGLAVNATRGVWVAIILAGLLELRYVWALMFATLPVALLGGYITYIALKATPFMQRLTDPNDLLVRFESWKLIGRIFKDHPLLGVGHMQYTKVYLNYVQNVSDVARFNVFNVGVADNIFLTTAAEHGLLGLVGLFIFLVVAYIQLRNLRIKLFRWGIMREATFVRCAELALVIYVVCGCLADVQLFTKASRFMFIIVGLGLAEGVRGVASSGVSAVAKSIAESDAPLPELWEK